MHFLFSATLIPGFEHPLSFYHDPRDVAISQDILFRPQTAKKKIKKIPLDLLRATEITISGESFSGVESTNYTHGD